MVIRFQRLVELLAYYYNVKKNVIICIHPSNIKSHVAYQTVLHDHHETTLFSFHNPSTYK